MKLNAEENQKKVADLLGYNSYNQLVDSIHDRQLSMDDFVITLLALSLDSALLEGNKIKGDLKDLLTIA